MSGRPFLQIPGPTNVPERVLRAMDRAVIDHRSPAFGALVRSLLPDLARVFKTERGRVIVYPTSGTGAWEASLVNVLAPGAAVLAFDHGHFSAGFAAAARNLGFTVDLVPLRWGQSVPAAAVAEHLQPKHRAVLLVHNETSTGVRSDVRAVREAIDAKGSDALLIVDTVSSLGSMDFRFDEWSVDVALTGSQKGLMLPPGSASCAPRRARSKWPRAAAARGTSSTGVRSSRTTPRVSSPTHPRRSCSSGSARRSTCSWPRASMRSSRGIIVSPRAFAPRSAHGVWASCARNRTAYSDSLTAVVMPEGLDSNALIARARDRFDLALGVGLGRLRGRVFRIGHLGALGELEVLATLGGVEMALRESGHAVVAGAGVAAAEDLFVKLGKPAEKAGQRA